MTQQVLKGVFLGVLVLAGCSASGGSGNPQEGCGGTEATVSCLEITSIAPKDSAGGNSSNVDAFQEVCLDPTTGAVTSTETFTDHNADITFSNMRFPTATSGFDIRIIGYSVSYSLNQCPALAQGCPPLTGFTANESILIPEGGTVTVTLPFVPLRVKNAFCAGGGERGSAIPSYTATYTFTAQTTRFNDTFTVTGSAQFTIGNFVENGFSCSGVTRIVPCGP
jgi:hypothetical protein